MQNSALINLEAEALVIGALMQENRLIDTAADRLAVEDFADPLHARLFDAILHEYAKGKRVTPVTLKGFFENDGDLQAHGGFAYLARLTGNATALLSPVENANLLAEIAERRRMQDGLTAAALDCADLTISPAEIVSRADEAISARANDAIHQPTGSECVGELLASYADKQHGVLCQKIPAVDDLLGALRPKQLVIGAGRPGMGKTAFALSYALGAAEAGHGVLFVSLEMSSTELGARMVSDVCFDRAKVPYHLIRDGKVSAQELGQLHQARDRMEAMPMHVIDAGNLTVGRLNMLIRKHARRMEAIGHKLDLVIVDYLQLLSPDGKHRSNYEAVSEVSRALKAMAKDHGIAMLALAQLSRSVEQRPDRRPQLSDLRDSGQIEQDADAVMFLLRPEYYLRQAEPEPGTAKRLEWQQMLDAVEGKIEFIVAKKRNGVTGSAFGDFHGAYQAVR